MEAIVENVKQGALDSATISLTILVSKPSMLLSHMSYKDIEGKMSPPSVTCVILATNVVQLNPSLLVSRDCTAEFAVVCIVSKSCRKS